MCCFVKYRFVRVRICWREKKLEKRESKRENKRKKKKISKTTKHDFLLLKYKIIIWTVHFFSLLFHRRRYSILRVFTIASKILYTDCMDIDDDDRTNARSDWITLPIFQSRFDTKDHTDILNISRQFILHTWVDQFTILRKKNSKRNTNNDCCTKFGCWLNWSLRLLFTYSGW